MSVNRISEADTRMKFIDPVIKNAGWTHNEMKLEFPVAIAGKKSKEYADYLLLDESGGFLAVVEAKRRTVESSTGIEQAMRYGKSLNTYFMLSTNGEDVILYDKFLDTYKTFNISKFPTKSELIRKKDFYNNMNVDVSGPVDMKISLPEHILEDFTETELKYMFLTVIPQLNNQIHPKVFQSLLHDMTTIFSEESGVELSKIQMQDFIEWYKSVASRFGGDVQINLSGEPINGFRGSRRFIEWKWNDYISYHTKNSVELIKKTKAPKQRLLEAKRDFDVNNWRWNNKLEEKNKQMELLQQQLESKINNKNQKIEGLELQYESNLKNEKINHQRGLNKLNKKLRDSYKREIELEKEIEMLNERLLDERFIKTSKFVKRKISDIFHFRHAFMKKFGHKKREESTNLSKEDILYQMENKKSKDRAISKTILFLILLLPVGIFMFYSNPLFSIKSKVIATFIIFFLVLSSL